MILPIDRYTPPHVLGVCRELIRAGGRPYLVGGCVRDMVGGIAPKDFDIEVYGLTLEKLTLTLSRLGRCQQVGKSFGVVKVWIKGLDIDVSLPRTEQKTHAGHQGFRVSADPNLDPRIASSRRDFTINAMMVEPNSGNLIDFHGGQRDLRAGVLRHISNAFAEDPLRVLRGMQFAARLALTLDRSTAEFCRKMLPEAETLAIERVWIEWIKWANTAHPSYGLAMLRECGWIRLYPELHALVGCAQSQRWHPEGDVWDHTLFVVDRAAAIADREGYAEERRLQLLFAALCHDFGKPLTSCEDEEGDVRSRHHDHAGVVPASSFLAVIGAPQRLSERVALLVSDHVTHLHGEPSDRAIRRLSARLFPATIRDWESLVESDASGRPPLPASRPALPWLQRAHEIDLAERAPARIVSGSLLIELGVAPGPQMGELLRRAYEAQLDGLFADEADARQWCSMQIGSEGVA